MVNDVVFDPPMTGGLKLYARIRSAVLWVLTVLGGLSIIIFLFAVLGGIRPSVVISGSMEPTIHTGDLTFARSVPSSSIEVGDIITVDRIKNQGQVTHRVVAIKPVHGGHSFTLKGDANADNDMDAYLFAEVGKVVGWIPYLGYIALALKSKAGIAFAISFVVGLLVLTIMDPEKLKPQSGPLRQYSGIRRVRNDQTHVPTDSVPVTGNPTEL